MIKGQSVVDGRSGYSVHAAQEPQRQVRTLVAENPQRFDFRSMLDGIGDAIRSASGSVSKSMQPAQVWTESGLKHAVLAALLVGPSTGHGIIESINASNDWGIKPPAARVYPLLESLLDEQLVTVSMVKDRKTYTLTKAGKAAVKTYVESTAESGASSGGSWTLPPLDALTGTLATASSRLARVAYDVAQHGSTEQRDAAAAAIDEARRKINEILAAK